MSSGSRSGYSRRIPAIVIRLANKIYNKRYSDAQTPNARSTTHYRRVKAHAIETQGRPHVLLDSNILIRPSLEQESDCIGARWMREYRAHWCVATQAPASDVPS
jgi:hypothetical protein